MSRLKTLFALSFIAGGVGHFVRPDIYLGIMPPYLPWHTFWVYASGLAEVVLGVLLLIRRTQVVAAWGLVVLLVLVFPANLHMALNASNYPIPSTFLWFRLPLQAVLIAWALRYTRQDPDRPESA